MSSRVHVLPLPINADRSHHGPPATDGYVAWLSQSLRYLPLVGSYFSSSSQLPPDYNQTRSPSPPGPAAEPAYFSNPWPSWKSLSISDAYSAYVKGATLKLAPREDEEEDEEVHGRLVKVLRPDFSRQAPVPRVCWMGHAGAFVQIPWKQDGGNGMCGVMFDPIFSKRLGEFFFFHGRIGTSH
jgi:hypothetical protein